MILPKRPSRGNCNCNRADRIERDSLPYPARRLADRLGLAPSRARLIAELAGFDVGARE
jgi:hypothetical protein